MESKAAAIVKAASQHSDGADMEMEIVSWILQPGEQNNTPLLIDAIARALIAEHDSLVNLIHDSMRVSQAIPAFDLPAKVREHRRAAVNAWANQHHHHAV